MDNIWVFFVFLPRVKLYKTSILCNVKQLILVAFNFECIWVCMRENVSVRGFSFPVDWETSVTLASLLQLTNSVDVVGFPAFLTIYLLYILSFGYSCRTLILFLSQSFLLASFFCQQHFPGQVCSAPPEPECLFSLVRPHMRTHLLII